MRRFMLAVAFLAPAMLASASEAPVPYEPPSIERSTLTAEYVEQNREYLEGIDSYFGNCTGGSPLHFNGEWSRFVSIVEYRDRTVHVIHSATPPEYLGEDSGRIRITASALVYSVSPSDRGACGENNYVELLGKSVTMDFQTTLRVQIWNDATLTITHRLSNATALPVAEMRIFELEGSGRTALYGLRFHPGERLPKLSTPYKRVAQKFRFTPAFSWDLGMMPGIIAVSEGYVPPVPGFTFLRNGRGTSYNLTGASLWLASSRDARLRFGKLGIGLAYDSHDIGAAFQFTPVSIAFGQKEKWDTYGDYSWLDRTRRRIYLDVGYNVIKYPYGYAHGPFVQTSICVLRCNP